MQHDYFMQMALNEAGKGFPNTAPNPLVGCVIVRNHEVIATGYHKKYGAPHAEVNAINNMPAEIVPSDCILYVTLEPCSHYGKTPPCADLVIQKGFKAVVIACKDPNPKVAGKGITKLQGAGIEVITGVLAKEARALNQPFFTFYEEKRPYIILKWAQTADGFISRIPAPKSRSENIITRKEAQEYVHRLRSEVMGILVGKNTVLADDPELTTRLVEGKNPLRLFIDQNLEVPNNFKIYNDSSPTIVFNRIKEEETGTTKFVKLDFEQEILGQISSVLYQLNIQSILVEGGSKLVNSFVNKDLWDEVLVFQNPDLFFRNGVKAPVFPIKNSFELIGDDKLYKHLRHESDALEQVIPKEIF